MIKAAVTRADEVFGTRNAASRRSHAGQSHTSAPVTGFPNGTGPMGDDPHHQQAPYPDLKFRNGFLMAAKRAFGGKAIHSLAARARGPHSEAYRAWRRPGWGSWRVAPPGRQRN